MSMILKIRGLLKVTLLRTQGKDLKQGFLVLKGFLCVLCGSVAGFRCINITKEETWQRDRVTGARAFLTRLQR